MHHKYVCTYVQGWPDPYTYTAISVISSQTYRMYMVCICFGLPHVCKVLANPVYVWFWPTLRIQNVCMALAVPDCLCCVQQRKK
jgi:hypothetical protein